MATTFAITGIHRSKLKHYRPNYHSDLPPIYEDSVSRQTSKLDKYKCVIPNNDDYMYVPSFSRNDRAGKRGENVFHEYEQIDDCKLSRVSACSPSVLERPCGSMLHGIMTSRTLAKNKTLDSNITREDNKDNGENTDKHSDKDGDENSKNKDTDVPLRRASSLYQGFSSTKDETNAIKTNVESAEEMGSNVTPSKKWRKLEPDPLKLPFWCPAEKKIKKRCFAVCFVILVLIIGTFVVVSLDGWIFKAKGHGLVGSEKPILWQTFGDMPEDNFTDIRQTTQDPL